MVDEGAGSKRAGTTRSVNMDGGGASWGIITIIAPLLIVIVFAWVVIKNRKSKTSIDQTEQATRDLYRKEDAAHRNDDSFGT